VPTTTTTTTTRPLPPACFQIVLAQQRFNAEMDARVAEISRRPASPERDALLLQLERERAAANARFNEQLNRCVNTATTTTTTRPLDRCAQIRQAQREFNAALDARLLAIPPGPQRELAIAQLQAERAARNAAFDQELARAGCLTPTTTTTTSTTTTTTPLDRCAELRQAQQRFNAGVDARISDIRRFSDSSEEESRVAQVERARAQGNAAFNEQLRRAEC
jgi:hypothetical protein